MTFQTFPTIPLQKLLIYSIIGIIITTWCSAEEIEADGTAKSGEFPWVVGIHSKRMSCSGALISKNLVLTAGHCLNNDFIKNPEYTITLGSLFRGDVSNDGNKVFRKGDLIIRHDEVDAAILRLSEAVNFTDTLRPISLPTRGDYIGGGVEVTTTGWRRIRTTRYYSLGDYDNLQITRGTTISNDECGNGFGFLEDWHMCFTNLHGNVCGGESGQAIVKYDNKALGNKGAVHVAMVVMGPYQCGGEGPEIGVRTSSIVDWIRATIAEFSK